jgi:ribonuclease P protein component
LFYYNDTTLAKQFTLQKEERLKSHKLIEQLFKEGKSFVSPPFRVYYILIDITETGNKGVKFKFGAGVSSKNFKKAVDRNRVKRITRESYRVQKNSLVQHVPAGKQLALFFIYTGRDLPLYKDVYEKMAVTLRKLATKISGSGK